MSRLLHTIISSAKLWSEEIGTGLNKRVDYLQNLATCHQSHDYFFFTAVEVSRCFQHVKTG